MTIDEVLHSKYDGLNQIIVLVEDKLKAMKPPHDVWVDAGGGFAVGIAKVNGSWRLAVSPAKDIAEMKPLKDMPIAIRVDLCSGNALNRLRDSITKAREDFVPEVEFAIQNLKDFLA